MKKFLCALIAVSMLAAQCAAYAETDTITNDITTDNDIELTSTPIESLTELTDEQISAVENAVIAAVEERNTDLDLEELKIPVTAENESAIVQNILNICNNTLADKPEYFYAAITTGSITYHTSIVNEDKTLTNIQNVFVYEDNIEEHAWLIDNEVKRIKKLMAADGITSDGQGAQHEFDVALWLHDYLVNSIKYDERTYSEDATERNKVKRTIEAALIDRLTVCEGYAKAYKYLLESFGVDCVNVYDSSEEHEWSAVKIGDKWYYVDVTQDDVDESRNLGYVSHEFFLVNEPEILAGGTHSENAFITERDDVVIGDEFAGKEWHDIKTAVAFNGDDRYYGGWEKQTSVSVIFKCGANLENSEVFKEIEGGKWHVDKDKLFSASAYYGGIGMFNNELYFNTPDCIKKISLNPENETHEAETVYTYTPEENENVNCLFGIFTDGSVLRFESVDLVLHKDSETGAPLYVSFENFKDDFTSLAKHTVTFVDPDLPDGANVVATAQVDSGFGVNIPEYNKYGYVVTGWNRDAKSALKWDFENDVVTDDITLYAETKKTNWQMQPMLRASEDCLIGTLKTSLSDFDDTYREAPAYMLAVYDNNVLVALRKSDSGEFTLTAEDNIPYTETTAVTVYAWSSEYEPYLGSASVTVQKRPSGEGEGETGDGEETGDGGDEGDSEGDTGNESGTGETGSETGGENTGSGETNE